MTAKATFTEVENGDGSAKLVQWTLTTADHTGQAIGYPEWSVRSFQVEGTFGGATLAIEGSNDMTNYRAITNQGDTVKLQWTEAQDILQAQQTCRKMRPRLTAVGVDASLVVSMLMVRPTPMRT